MKILNYVLLFSLVFILSCKEKSNPAKTTNDLQELVQGWTNSFEEETDSINIYRPSNYKQYPIARYRDGFDLQNDGKCIYMVLSPNDAHYSVAGTWSVNVSSDTIVELRDTVGGVHYKLKVVELKNDLLRVLKLK
jgi:hypothetical protein